MQHYLNFSRPRMVTLSIEAERRELLNVGRNNLNWQSPPLTPRYLKLLSISISRSLYYITIQLYPNHRTLWKVDTFGEV